MAKTASSQTKAKKVSLLQDILNNKFSYLIALPAIAYVFIFSYWAYPYMVVAFQRFNFRNNNLWAIFTQGEWVGFDNFRFFFASHHAAVVTFNTLYLNLLFIITGTVAAVLIAILLNELTSKIFVNVSQSMMILPSYISWVVVSFMLMGLFSSQHGLLNRGLEFFNHSGINWYLTPEVWPTVLVIMRIWRGAGMTAIIFLASIAGMGSEFFEAAAIDGANRFQQIIYIRLPLLMPTIIIMTLLSVGRIMFGDFGMIYAIVRDNGVLFSTTDIIDTFLFRALRQVGDPSQAMAIGLFQSAIGFVLVFGSNWLARKFYPDGALY